MFRKISTKIGLIFAGLFAFTMMMISIATYAVVTSNAKEQVADQMAASSAVFSRLFLQIAENTYADAVFYAKDFGFRATVTSGDGPTITSALRTMASRLGVTSVAFLDVDGDVLGEVGQQLPTTRLTQHIVESDGTSLSERDTGVLFAGDTPFIVGAAPVYAPDLVGWVFFGDAITQSTLEELKSLAPLALEANIVASQMANQSMEAAAPNSDDLSFTRAIPTFFSRDAVALVLTYPLSEAIRPYQLLIAILLTLIVAGGLAVSVASWLLARRLAQPISALSDAAKRIRDGQGAQVTLETRDELADLATSFNDMSAEIVRREEDLQIQARTNKESGLPNRLAFEEAITALPPNGGPAFVLVIGLERFGEIRNAIGFDVTAQLIRTVGERLGDGGHVETLAHLSGGVFAAVIRAKDASAAQTQIVSLREDLEQTYTIGATPIDVMFKVGISQLAHGVDTLQHAMIALEQARARYVDDAFFDEKSSDAATANLSLMGDLMTALEEGHVSVAYQPKYDLRTQEAVGAEALVRWKDPARGQVFPDVFIPLAEETGRIDALSRYVLKHAVDAQHALWAAGHEIAMSVNVSGRLIGNNAFTSHALALAKTAAGPLCFEITETAVIEDPEKGIAAIKRFADAGIDISIDDYGSGLSSLAYLKRIPANELKIDKEFVLKVDESQRDALLVRSTIDLAHSLGLKVTAEGIETAAAASLLAGMGCDVGQGYGLGRPMPLADLLKHLAGPAEQANPVNQAQAKA